MGKQAKQGGLDPVMPWEEGEEEKQVTPEARLRKGREVGVRLIAEALAEEERTRTGAEIKRQAEEELAAEEALERKMYKPGKPL